MAAEQIEETKEGETGEDSKPSDAAETDNSATTMEAAAKKSPLVMALMHLKWASFLQRAGQNEKAAFHFAESAALRPSARAHFGRGTCLAALRRREEAVEALEQALELSPNLAGVHVNLAGVHLAMRHFAEAEQHCRQAMALEPGAREAVMNLANALRNLDRREEAMQVVWQHIVAEETASAAEASANAATLGAEVEAGGYPCEGATPATASTAPPPIAAEPQEPSCSLATTGATPPVIDCSSWTPLPSQPHLTIVCVKWGTRYDADYVNRLHAGVRRHLTIAGADDLPFVCFTDDASGLAEGIEARALPKDATLWWGKAYLFSKEAGLDGQRVLFLDLDQVIVGDLHELAAYRGPFAILSTDGIACELAEGGYNSSVMAWEASEFFRPIYSRLSKAALKYVHRFDHWLEMNVEGAGLWQHLAPGRIIDYTAAFRGGICIGSSADEDALDEGSFVAPAAPAAAATAAEVDASAAEAEDIPAVEKTVSESATRRGAEEMPKGAALVTFPRNPKPHEVIDRHAWVRQHWLGESPGHECLVK